MLFYLVLYCIWILAYFRRKDFNMTKSLNLGHSVDSNSLVDMSKSLAGFHLTTGGANKMHESTMDQVSYLNFIL